MKKNFKCFKVRSRSKNGFSHKSDDCCFDILDGCSENISIVAYPGQRLSLSEDRRGDINAPRRVRSISGVDCKSPVPAVSYAEFMRRATSSKHQNQWEDPRDICLDQTKSECDARLRFGNDSVHSCNDKSLG